MLAGAGRAATPPFRPVVRRVLPDVPCRKALFHQYLEAFLLVVPVRREDLRDGFLPIRRVSRNGRAAHQVWKNPVDARQGADLISSS